MIIITNGFVCAVWQVGAENAALKKLVDLMPNVKYSGDKTDIVGGFDPASLLPGLHSLLGQLIKTFYRFTPQIPTRPVYTTTTTTTTTNVNV